MSATRRTVLVSASPKLPKRPKSCIIRHRRTLYRQTAQQPSVTFKNLCPHPSLRCLWYIQIWKTKWNLGSSNYWFIILGTWTKSMSSLFINSVCYRLLMPARWVIKPSNSGFVNRDPFYPGMKFNAATWDVPVCQPGQDVIGKFMHFNTYKQ